MVMLVEETTLPNEASELLQEVEEELKSIMGTLGELKQKIGNDDLTGLLRRGEFFSRLTSLPLRYRNQEIVLIMLDIDNFKQLNDREGHQAGDHTLKRAAAVISRCAQAGATTGRYGGEEFIVALRGSRKVGKALGEALRRQIAKEVGVTVSVGVASAHRIVTVQEVEGLVARADSALLRAKRNGKNRICVEKEQR